MTFAATSVKIEGEKLNCLKKQKMAEFNFDSESNKISTKTPAIKAIGGGIKDPSGKVVGAGLWIANENAEICEWKKNCLDTCDFSCMKHLRSVIPHEVDTKRVEKGVDIVIAGNVIVNPRMLIIGRSPLLKINEESGFTIGIWNKGDNQFKKSDGKNLYTCIRRYFIIFLDENNLPLHNIEQPIQLTARGYFQLEFDKKYMFFRSNMVKAYNESTRKNATNMSDAWHAMCIFAPKFKSEMRGPSKDKQSKACITNDYEKPTKDNWISLCVGKSGDFTQQIYKIHCENREWWMKSIKKEKQQFSEENVFMNEEDFERGMERGIESLSIC